MSLPSPVIPRFDLTVPSTNKVISVRPFTMKEEKLLLVALEGGKATELIKAAHVIVDTCTNGAINTDKSPLFDVQYAFLQIRAKSVGEISDFMVVCGSCDAKSPAQIDLTKIQVEHSPGHSTRIDFTAEMGVVMRYPTIEHLELVSKTDSDLQKDTFDMIASCIESVFTVDEIFATSEEPKEKVIDYLESLPVPYFEKIKQFFASMPVLRYEFKHVCQKCNTENSLSIEGIESFFA